MFQSNLSLNSVTFIDQTNLHITNEFQQFICCQSIFWLPKHERRSRVNLSATSKLVTSLGVETQHSPTGISCKTVSGFHKRVKECESPSSLMIWGFYNNFLYRLGENGLMIWIFDGIHLIYTLQIIPKKGIFPMFHRLEFQSSLHGNGRVKWITILRQNIDIHKGWDDAVAEHNDTPIQENANLHRLGRILRMDG